MIIDLSLPIKNHADSEITPAKIKHIGYKKGAFLLGLGHAISPEKSFIEKLKGIVAYLSGKERLTHRDFPENMALAFETLNLSTHCGTHVDAPLHFGPISESMQSEGIDSIPLEWFYNDGVILDLKHKRVSEIITAKDIKNALDDTNYKIKPYDIILIHTASDKLWGKKEYFYDYPGMSEEATTWLIDQGIRVIGIDTWGFDRPSKAMIRDYFKTGDKSCLWPAHLVGRRKKYCHIEKLAQLDKIPNPFGFKVACFPVRIENATAAWARVVAIV